MKKILVEEQVLRDMYINKSMSTAEIAVQLGISKNTVNRKLREFNIPLRDVVTAQKAGMKSWGEKVKEARTDNWVICDHCGKRFYRRSSWIKDGHNFCSRDCESRYRVGKIREDLRTGKYVQCDNCGKLVYKNKYLADNFDLHFCNRECQKTFFKESRMYKSNNNSRFTKVTVKCKTCGKEFDKTYSQYIRSEEHFCCVECAIQDKQSNASYVGWRRGPNWPEQRQAALERDGHVCQICSTHQDELENCSLNIHHIKRYRDFDSYLEANELDNLISLCPRCHAIAEYYQLTKSQILDFDEQIFLVH